MPDERYLIHPKFIQFLSFTFQGSNFKTFDDLISFIGLRTNVFEASFDLIRNHSQEFREMFGYLVNFLCDTNQIEHSVETVLQVIMRFDSVSSWWHTLRNFDWSSKVHFVFLEVIYMGLMPRKMVTTIDLFGTSTKVTNFLICSEQWTKHEIMIFQGWS